MTTLEKIITNEDCKYGAPMGRASYGEPNGKQVYISQVQLNEGYDVGGAYWGTPNNLYVEYTEDLEYVFFLREGDVTLTGKTYLPPIKYTLRPKLCKFSTKKDWREEIQAKVNEIDIYLIYNDAEVTYWCDTNPLLWCMACYVDIDFKDVTEYEKEDVYDSIYSHIGEYTDYYSFNGVNPIRDLTYKLRDDEDTMEDVREMIIANPIYI
jgi:hypothetical protein